MEAASSQRSAEQPYCLILDANIWVAERLLQSSIGSALLYALATTRSTSALPEVVELEVNEVLLSQAETAVANIARDISLLRELSRQRPTFGAPASLAITHGIAARWDELAETVSRVVSAISTSK